MTDQQRPDEDVEGHGSKPRLDDEASADDVEGHKRALQEEGSVDDVAGHTWTHKQDDTGDDDVAGHVSRPR